jgi:hypothetical protein
MPGAKRKDKCPMCGVPKTAENTTTNKKRGFISYCKLCQSEIAHRRLVRNMTEDERLKSTEKYERILRILKEANETD